VPNLPSAAKRVKQNERNRERNRTRKRELKTETRKLLDALQGGNADQTKAMLSKVSKKLDQTAAKGTLHPNTAARRKSRMAKRVNAALAAATKGK